MLPDVKQITVQILKSKKLSIYALITNFANTDVASNEFSMKFNDIVCKKGDHPSLFLLHLKYGSGIMITFNQIKNRPIVSKKANIALPWLSNIKPKMVHKPSSGLFNIGYRNDIVCYT